MNQISNCDKNQEVTFFNKSLVRFFKELNSRQVSGERPVTNNEATMQGEEAILFLQDYEETRQGWFWSTDQSGNITYISASIAQILEQEREELVGTSFLHLFQPDQENCNRERPLSFILAKRSKFQELTLRAAIDSDERWWSVSGEPQYDASGNFSGYRGSGKDITAHRRSQQDTSRLSKFDTLTGLLNRNSISNSLETILSGSQAEKQSCTIMRVDLDRFKLINDTLGHPAGDILLKQVAVRCAKVIGKSGVLARIGGDEFQVNLAGVDDRQILADLAIQLITSLSQPYSVNGSRCVISASVGISMSPFDGLSCNDLMRSADLALQAAKSGGRGRFCFFSPSLQQSAEDRRILEEDLRDALQKNEISLYYQPLVNAQNHHVTGFEALMRWNHGKRGPISPEVFIPIAEDAGLIEAFGEWAIKKACADAAKWPDGLRVAVNVSPTQFANENLPSLVSTALDRSGLSPERLELEITESVFLGESEDATKMFTALKKLGVRLALDDFGTGYSSLSYLQTAPFDKIKIDQCFVRGATLEGSRNGAIIAAIVALAEALDMETTAEGIESLDELAWIRDMRVSHVQGYVYSKAISDDEIREQCEGGDWVLKPMGPAKNRHARFSMFRKIGVIHDDYYYSAMLRNLSESGALIEGLIDVPVGTEFVIDLGDGQLVVATVQRSVGQQQGVRFEKRLVKDGNGGLCTANRVSPYLIAAEGVKVGGMPKDFYRTKAKAKERLSIPVFATSQNWIAGELC